MKYTIEFELPNNKTIEDELQGAYVSWSIWGYSGIAKAKPVEEPKKGKWLPHPGYRDWDVCSACGIGCKRREYGLMPYGAKEWMTEYSYQYCPNCGVKMEVTE